MDKRQVLLTNILTTYMQSIVVESIGNLSNTQFWYDCLNRIDDLERSHGGYRQ